MEDRVVVNNCGEEKYSNYGLEERIEEFLSNSQSRSSIKKEVNDLSIIYGADGREIAGKIVFRCDDKISKNETSNYVERIIFPLLSGIVGGGVGYFIGNHIMSEFPDDLINVYLSSGFVFSGLVSGGILGKTVYDSRKERRDNENMYYRTIIDVVKDDS